MHMQIGIIINFEKDDDKRRTISNVGSICERLCDESIFDGYNVNSDRYEIDSDIYEDTGKIINTKSKKGKELIKTLLEDDVREFCKTLNELRKILYIKDNNKLLYDDNFRHNCYKAGQQAGHCVSLYDSFGEGLRNDKEVQETLKYIKNPHIVCADMHY